MNHDRYALVIELMTVTQGFMVVLSLDRVVAMVTALRYDQLVTTRRLWIVSIIIWTGSVIFPIAGLADVIMESEHCIFQLFLPRYSFVLYGASSLALIFFIVGLNLLTLRKTLGHIEQIAVTVVGEAKEAGVAAMNHKAAVTSLIVVLPFLLLCSPIYVLFFFFFAFFPGLTETLDGLVAITVCLGLIIGNSLLNPFIYVWRSLEVRAEVKRFLCLRKLFAQDNPP